MFLTQHTEVNSCEFLEEGVGQGLYHMLSYGSSANHITITYNLSAMSIEFLYIVIKSVLYFVLLFFNCHISFVNLIFDLCLMLRMKG